MVANLPYRFQIFECFSSGNFSLSTGFSSKKPHTSVLNATNKTNTYQLVTGTILLWPNSSLNNVQGKQDIEKNIEVSHCQFPFATWAPTPSQLAVVFPEEFLGRTLYEGNLFLGFRLAICPCRPWLDHHAVGRSGSNARQQGDSHRWTQRCGLQTLLRARGQTNLRNEVEAPIEVSLITFFIVFPTFVCNMCWHFWIG